MKEKAGTTTEHFRACPIIIRADQMRDIQKELTELRAAQELHKQKEGSEDEQEETPRRGV